MDLSSLKPPKGVKKRKRVGRGPGSGHGKTSTRGSKGQKSRSGGGKHPRFEGGQTPLYRRVPKRGFRPLKRVEYQIVNLRDLNRFRPDTEVTPEVLHKEGLVSKKRLPVKILGEGDIKIPLKISAHFFSKSARRKLEAIKAEITDLS